MDRNAKIGFNAETKTLRFPVYGLDMANPVVRPAVAYRPAAAPAPGNSRRLPIDLGFLSRVGNVAIFIGLAVCPMIASIGLLADYAAR